ncbi:hypothetical protein LG198_07260 [Methylobacillus arboreus]|uniref:hypothetical protein n=1 Tax=Methylobacillus arboreus TaxID=755170 RepID=UPI001E5D92BA|nr:hypothetical protein [Methylobacillus arboreus]MCB5190503.1 hypothetical protein [Methylobacillus arboreus]MCB5190521.1 hypothetical protein [Methylobacillus arboreus]
MKKTLSIVTIALVAAWAPFAQAESNPALFEHQVLAAATINPSRLATDARISETEAVISHKDVVQSRNNRPHFRHHFNVNRIDTSGVSADRNAGKKFVYVAHPKHGFKVKRYVGVH